MKKLTRNLKMLALSVLPAVLLAVLIGCQTPPKEEGSSGATESAESTATSAVSSGEAVRAETTLSEAALLDKIEGGWIGQMVGVVWGAPTEFGTAGSLMGEYATPKWDSSKINDAFGQDDLYVEIPFLDAMKEGGVNCDPALCAEKFKKTSFALWHANGMGRQNLQDGIGYPDSGSYLNNYHADDIDWQIECDFLGMLYPGRPADAAARAFELGHIMNYGDGVYGGVFVSAMHASAFTADSIEQICLDGTRCIPEGSDFRALLEDVWESYRAGDSFQKNWHKLQNKWGDADICPELKGVSNIDAKLNSGYILLGLLYGEGDMDKTILLSMRCGQDSDCNPSSAASILGNFYGAKQLDEKYTKKLERRKIKFSFTRYNFNQAVQLNADLAEEAFAVSGIEKTAAGWVFTPQDPVPVKLEQIPNGVYAYLRLQTSGSKVIFKELTTYHKQENVTGYRIDMGDGFSFVDATPGSYTYAKSGSYTVTVTVYGDKGSETKVSRTVKVAGGKLQSRIPVCNVVNPFGAGARDLEVICDGRQPTAPGEQYDTYILGDPHGNPPTVNFIGYVFREAQKVSTLSFTEGAHCGNGGWFDKTVRVECLTAKGWEEVSVRVTPDYPGKSGASYQTYTFTLSVPTECMGVRLAGIGGGSASFISCGELTVS